MACFAVFLTILYAKRYGLSAAQPAKALAGVGRQLVATAVVAGGLYYASPWLATIEHTSLDGAFRLAAVLVPAAALYVGIVALLGGRELALLVSAFKGGEPT